MFPEVQVPILCQSSAMADLHMIKKTRALFYFDRNFTILQFKSLILSVIGERGQNVVNCTMLNVKILQSITAHI